MKKGEPLFSAQRYKAATRTQRSQRRYFNKSSLCPLNFFVIFAFNVGFIEFWKNASSLIWES